MSMELDLIPAGTLLEENGKGTAGDIRGSQTRTFFCIMTITDQIEQESLDVSIWCSADGENWGAHPTLKLPQSFYRGEVRAVLDLNMVPEANFVRAGWELNRWGRVDPKPMFVAGLHLAEVPAIPHGNPASHATTAK